MKLKITIPSVSFAIMLCSGLAISAGHAEQFASSKLTFSGPLKVMALAEPEEEDVAQDEATDGAVEECETDEFTLSLIEEERDRLEKRRGDISEAETEITIQREKLAVERENLMETRSEIKALLARVERAQTEDLDRLVKTYTSMKPQDAATLMNDLDIELSVMMFGQMKPSTVGPIMAQMNPIRAQAISKILFERSQLPGDQDLNGLRLK